MIKSKPKSQKSKLQLKTKNFRFCVVSLIFLFWIFALPALAANWQGVDESVVEKVAKEHGRPAWTPFINTDQGDLLLFVFLLAGATGGFLLGFYWRKLFYEK